MAKDFIGSIPGILSRVKNNAVSNMVDALNLVSIEASRRAPIDTNRLRTNIKRNIFVLGNGKILGEFIFWQPYAEVQHEHEEFIHPKGGEAKYVEKAIRAEATTAVKIMGRNIIK